MIGNYKVAHLLGITREHEPQFRHVEQELTKQGYICFAPAIYNFDIYLQHKDMLNDMCYQKLLMCDLCVIVTPEHIGESTTNRIKQAKELNIPIYLWYEKLVEYSYKDYIITCHNGKSAKDLFIKFKDMIRDNNEYKSSSEINRSVTLINGDRYRFISFYDRRKYIDGFSGDIISELTFEDMMKNFNN